jgi:hexokinase
MEIGAMARIMLISTGSSVVDLPQNLQHQIQEYEETFTVSTETLKKVVDHFEKELEKGLSVEGGNIVSCLAHILR